jgi:pilus assembly protein CpaC
LLCHCQFIELSPRAVEEFYAAADLVTARSAAKVGPEFGVCRRAEVALGKLSLGECSKRFDWPPVVATTEKPASVLSGGEFPILIPVADGRVAVQWKRFGCRAEVVPRWLETGRLQLDITAEIASKDFAHAVTSNGLTVPGLTTRRANARVELNLGETAVVNLGAVPVDGDDEATAASSGPDRPAVSGTSERPRSEHSVAERTITLFLVTPTAAMPASGAGVEGK